MERSKGETKMKTIHINLEYKCEDFTQFMTTMIVLGQKIDEIDDLFMKSCSVKEVEED